MDAGSMGGMGGAGGAGGSGSMDFSQLAKMFGGGEDKKKKSIFPEDLKAVQPVVSTAPNEFLQSLVASIKNREAQNTQPLQGNPGEVLKQAFAANKLQSAPAAQVVEQPIQPMQQPAPLNPQELDQFGNPIQKRMLLS